MDEHLLNESIVSITLWNSSTFRISISISILILSDTGNESPKKGETFTLKARETVSYMMNIKRLSM